MKFGTAGKIRVIGMITFALYLIALVYFLFFSESYGRTVVANTYHYNLIPFKEIRRFWDNRALLGAQVVFTNLFGNVIAFMPFGFFLPLITKRRSGFGNTVLLAFCSSLLVELIQLLCRVGAFDVDDMILNTLGGALGCILYYICHWIRRAVRE